MGWNIIYTLITIFLVFSECLRIKVTKKILMGDGLFLISAVFLFFLQVPPIGNITGQLGIFVSMLSLIINLVLFYSWFGKASWLKEIIYEFK
ncbi:MAG: hypothetical protein ACRCX8_13770 [Sarcina sp.]